MFAILHALGMLLVDLFKSRRRLEAENLFLRHQLTIALRRAPPRRRLRGSDRALLTWMTWLWPSLVGMAQVVQPETILRWHRAGFKAFWHWKSLNRTGRPKIDRGLRDLIQRMNRENPLWDPWRAPDARVRGRPVDGLEILGACDFASIAVAKWLCGTSDRNFASRMSRPSGQLR